MENSIKTLSATAILGLAFATVTPSYAAQTEAGQESVSGGGRQGSGWIGGRMDTNLYIGGNFGQTRFRTSCDGVPVPCDDKDTGWKLYGGYQFHRNIAIQVGYFNLGKVRASGVVPGVGEVAVEGKVNGAELLGVGIFPLNDQISFYGMLGVARSRVNVSAAGPALIGLDDKSTDLTYGLGAQYSFTRNIAARVEWQRYADVGGDNTGKEDIDLFSLGVVYKF